MSDEKASTPNGNLPPLWRDVELLRAQHQRELERVENETNHKLDRAHDFYSSAHYDLARVVDRLGERIDQVESVLDQQRGARNLVYGLIGTNILLAVMTFGTIAHLMGVI
jgi:hypothetical protein